MTKNMPFNPTVLETSAKEPRYDMHGSEIKPAAAPARTPSYSVGDGERRRSGVMTTLNGSDKGFGL